MDSVKYIGMDVHKEAISIAVLNSSGKLVMECIIETKASFVLGFPANLGSNPCLVNASPSMWISSFRLSDYTAKRRHLTTNFIVVPCRTVQFRTESCCLVR